jgi:isopentenyl-diphosphate delta-isomerase type 1
MAFRKTTDDQQEMFVIVDKNDKVVGQATRGECHRNKNLIHRGVVILVFNDQGELYLQKRSVTKDLYPGLWSLSAGGHVAYGETYNEAAKKEMQEELGIEVPLRKIGKFFHQDQCEAEMNMAYKAIYNGPFKLSSEEIDEGRFFDLEDLAKKVSSEGIKLTPCAKHGLKFSGILK